MKLRKYLLTNAPMLATDAYGKTKGGDLATNVPANETDPLSLHLDQTTPQTVTGEIKVVNSGTVNRVSGLISSIVVGLRTRTYTRNASGFVTSMTDGTNTWTYTRDANNNVTSWAVT